MRWINALSFVVLSASCLSSAEEEAPPRAAPQALEESSDAEDEDDPMVEMLSHSGEWELLPHPVQLTDEPIADSRFELTETDLAVMAEAAAEDQTWYAEDGERYEAIYISDEGVGYGRRGPAPSMPDPTQEGGGGFNGLDPVDPLEPSESELEQGIRRLEQSQKGEPVAGVEPLGDLTNPLKPSAGRIGTDWTVDRRTRRSTNLTAVPWRWIGAMSGDGDTDNGGCTGTKIGPRAVLTASHCVMNDDGDIALNGFFNPGQTSTTTPNGSIARNGLFLRDYRIDPKYDYAVVYLADSAAVVGLGWIGVAYWTDEDDYADLSVGLAGYPCGANGPNSCGSIAVQRCAASARADKRCDGWMYTDTRDLYDGSYRGDDQLEYDNDMSSGQSGSAVYTILGESDRRALAVNVRSINNVSMGPRFRSSMWNDVCTWIAHPAKQSAFGSHPSCN